jgi:hypothetical protein
MTAMKYFLWVLIAQVVTISLTDGQQVPRDFIHPSDSLQEQNRQLPRRLAVDSFTENGNNNKEDKALADGALKVALALLYARLTYVAEFPTAATSYNISDQCKADSQIYYDSYLGLQTWALRSI